MNPKISIITISMNSAKTLERTIITVISQDYDNFEYIIVDGGSTDGTVDIIREYENFITKWVSEPDNGISDAFNKGIAMANGEIIGIINSDDGLMPGALSAIAENYKKDVDVYIGKLLIKNEAAGVEYVGSVPNLDGYLSGVSHPSTFITKAAYNRFGTYDTKCRYFMDCDMMTRLYRGGAKYKKMDEVLAFFTMEGVTFSKYTKEKYRERVYTFKKNGASSYVILVYTIKRYAKNFIIAILGRNTVCKIKSVLWKK